MKHCFVINPAAGKGKVQNKLEQQIRNSCDELGVDYSVYYTACEGDCEKYVGARCAEGGDIRFYPAAVTVHCATWSTVPPATATPRSV